MPRFTTEIVVRFNHVDAAGIVYYPRYYEMINQAGEIWFEDALEYPYPKMFAEGWAVPLAHLESSFKNPSYLNDRLTFALGVTKIGRSRIDLSIVTTCKDEIRFLTRQSIVWVNHKTIKSAMIPDDVRAKMEGFLLDEAEDISF
ncbi:MAG: thioesterase [Alphaproteobacteria bacterium]|nr:MAG: thioesterase [Alphaproteobacteria bacterium]